MPGSSLATEAIRLPPSLERADPGTFEAIFHALEASSLGVIGQVRPRLLALPIRDDRHEVVGGVWGCTMLGWLHVQMLFVPVAARGRGVGRALLAAAEHEARQRGCIGAHLDSFGFQAPGFYEKQGYALFGVLSDFPPGHDRRYFFKRFVAPDAGPRPVEARP